MSSSPLTVSSLTKNLTNEDNKILAAEMFNDKLDSVKDQQLREVILKYDVSACNTLQSLHVAHIHCKNVEAMTALCEIYATISMGLAKLRSKPDPDVLLENAKYLHSVSAKISLLRQLNLL